MERATELQIDTIRQSVLQWHMSKPQYLGYNHVHAITEYLLNQQGLTMENTNDI